MAVPRSVCRTSKTQSASTVRSSAPLPFLIHTCILYQVGPSLSVSSTTSSPKAYEWLQRVPLARLLAHPANANLISEERLAKLAQNIDREGRYPPLIVRPYPGRVGYFQLLDGHQRADVLRRVGHEHALCYV